jgi:cytochrome c biogenesis protein
MSKRPQGRVKIPTIRRREYWHFIQAHVKGISMNQDRKASRLSDQAWNFFLSVKLTVFLLLSLAATSIIGTVIPQNGRPADYFQTYGESLYRLMAAINSVFSIFDMYHSWWFQLLLVLLTVNIIICSVERFSATWKIVRKRGSGFKASRFKNVSEKRELTCDGSAGELNDTSRQLAVEKFGYTRTEDTEQGFRVFGETGRWSRLGVYIVHLSVIVLLVGGLIGSKFGFDGYVDIPEGEKASRISIPNKNEIRQLDFEIRCDDFDVSYYETGQPKEYRSSLTILENGKPVLQKDVIVNDPLTYKGINFYQSSLRELPPRQTAQTDPQKIALEIQSRETGMSYMFETAIGKKIDIPEGLGQITLTDFKKGFKFRDTDLGDVLVGKLIQKNGIEVDVILPVRFPGFDKMGPMLNPKRTKAVFIQILNSPSGNTPMEKRYATILGVTKDPGVWMVYTGFIMMIIGFFITFFMSHQILFIEIIPADSRFRIIISGIANKNKLGMQRKIDRLFVELQKRLSGP